MYFKYTEFLDPIGFGARTKRRKYHAACSLSGFANDKIRVVYKINVTFGETIPEFFLIQRKVLANKV